MSFTHYVDCSSSPIVLIGVNQLAGQGQEGSARSAAVAGSSRAGRSLAAIGSMSPLGHSLHFGSVSMSGLPPTTTEWRTVEMCQ
jgi:hypothetical protein